MNDFSKCLLGIVGSVGGFALDHISAVGAIFGALASLATALFMFGCAHEKWIVVRRLKKQGSMPPFPPLKQ